jgi:succinate-semialdehyde dehydrogenase / glutarate-semialdehyde dehydrogenase
MAIATTNPATGEIEKTFEALSDAEVDERIARAAATAAGYRGTSFADRARWMNAAADHLDAAVEDIARVMTTEMGKTIVAARAEVKKCANGCRF